MGSVVKTTAAEDSLLSIGQYIAAHSQSLETAVRVLLEIDQKLATYAEFPHMGQARPDLKKEARCFSVYDYVIIYEPRHDGILVLLAVHSAEDIEQKYRHLFDPKN